jgi:SAM-dependent methyltransferase
MLCLALRSAPLLVARSSRAHPRRPRAAAMSSNDGPALPQGSAPAQTFFRDQIYVNAKAQGRRVPWDIGAPQPALVSVASAFSGSLLDVGAGLGDNAIWLASLPGVTRVTAVDISPDAVAEAAARLASASPQPRAPVAVCLADVFALPAEMTAFDSLLDSAVFHCIGDDDAQRRYLAAVTPRVKPGGKAVMLVFSDANPDPWMGPRRISAAHARQMWTDAGWRVDSLSEDVYYRDSMGRNDGKGGYALLMVATRAA